MSKSDFFIGKWELVPELSIYEQGTPPASGTYEISKAGSDLVFSISWKGQGDTEVNKASFSGIPDGRRKNIPLLEESKGMAPDGMSLTKVSSKILDSEALIGDKVISYARRVVSSDKSILAVMQETTIEGRSIRNFQVYRRTE